MDGTVSARDEDEWDTESAQQTIDLQSATGNELVLLQALRTVTGGQRGAETVLAQHGLTLQRPHGLTLFLFFIILSKIVLHTLNCYYFWLPSDIFFLYETM